MIATFIKFLKDNWMGVIPIIVSIIAAVIALISWRLSKSNFLLTHRPFVWVENFGYLNEQNILITPPNQVIIRVLNSPAQIISEEFSYYIVKDKGIDYIEKQNYKNFIRYPDDKSQYTNVSAKITDDLIDNLKEEQELRRFIRIQYKWLSSKKKYFFEAEWKYNRKDKKWDTIYQKAN